MELKGGVGALGADEEGEEAPVSWDGAIADYREPPDTGSRRGGDTAGDGKGDPGAAGPGSAPALPVRLWGDFLRVPLHPRSLQVIRQFLHDGDCGGLESFGQGERLLQDPACRDELEDRLRFFVEECDHLQGFQVLCDLQSGFSGVGSKVTELLRDEYGTKGILSWGLSPALSGDTDPQKSLQRLLNVALGVAHLCQHSSLLCPLSLAGSWGLRPHPPVTFPYIRYDASQSLQSSAVLAAVLDTLSAPYRLWSSQGSMGHLADSLAFCGRKVVAPWAALPLLAPRGSSVSATLSSRSPQDPPWERLCPAGGERSHRRCFAQSVVLRGIGGESYDSPEELLQRFLRSQSPGAASSCHVLRQPCPIPPSFPQFFSPELNARGFLGDGARAPSEAVRSVPVLAALRCSAELLPLLRGLLRDLSAPHVRRRGSATAGLEHDDFQEALEELRSLAQLYQNGSAEEEEEDEADSD